MLASIYRYFRVPVWFISERGISSSCHVWVLTRIYLLFGSLYYVPLKNVEMCKQCKEKQFNSRPLVILSWLDCACFVPDWGLRYSNCQLFTYSKSLCSPQSLCALQWVWSELYMHYFDTLVCFLRNAMFSFISSQHF